MLVSQLELTVSGYKLRRLSTCLALSILSSLSWSIQCMIHVPEKRILCGLGSNQGLLSSPASCTIDVVATASPPTRDPHKPPHHFLRACAKARRGHRALPGSNSRKSVVIMAKHPVPVRPLLLGTLLFTASCAVVKYTRSYIFMTAIPLSTHAAVYALSLPLVWAQIALIRHTTSSKKQRLQLLQNTVLVTATGGLLHSVALVWFPSIYGGWKSGITKCVAWIMFIESARLVGAIALSDESESE
ncbi:hypothetical protein BC830DRAFT_276809 [Chytriomyces sp. MP71]|nr:hypothetical protein BC830DRAFT_276809 [Chytriomyces sp. MP71]